MRTSNVSLNKNKIFSLIAASTVALLLVPLLGSQFYDGINWTIGDYIIAGLLIFTFTSVFVLAARKAKKNRLIIAAILGIVFIYVWAELAVGIFTNLGS